MDTGTREPLCRCKSTCLDVVEPVCASNGKTYRNQCTMDQVTVNTENRSQLSQIWDTNKILELDMDRNNDVVILFD